MFIHAIKWSTGSVRPSVSMTFRNITQKVNAAVDLVQNVNKRARVALSVRV